MPPHSLRNQILHHALQNRLNQHLALRAQIPRHRLLRVLREHINLEINALPHLLARQHHFLLGVHDEHDLEPALGVVDGGDGEAGAIERDVPLVHDVAQDVEGARREAERQRVAVGEIGRAHV